MRVLCLREEAGRGGGGGGGAEFFFFPLGCFSVFFLSPRGATKKKQALSCCHQAERKTRFFLSSP